MMTSPNHMPCTFQGAPAVFTHQDLYLYTQGSLLVMQLVGRNTGNGLPGDVKSHSSLLLDVFHTVPRLSCRANPTAHFGWFNSSLFICGLLLFHCPIIVSCLESIGPRVLAFRPVSGSPRTRRHITLCERIL